MLKCKSIIYLLLGMSVEQIFSFVETTSTIITVTAKTKTTIYLGIRSLMFFVYPLRSKIKINFKSNH